MYVNIHGREIATIDTRVRPHDQYPYLRVDKRGNVCAELCTTQRAARMIAIMIAARIAADLRYDCPIGIVYDKLVDLDNVKLAALVRKYVVGA